MFNIQAVPQSGVSNGRDVRFIPPLRTSVGVEMWICHYTAYSRKTYIKWEWVSHLIFQQKSLCHIALRGSRCVYATFLLCICYHRSLIQACGLYAGCSRHCLWQHNTRTHTNALKAPEGISFLCCLLTVLSNPLQYLYCWQDVKSQDKCRHSL